MVNLKKNMFFYPRNSVSLVIPFTCLQCLHHITHTHFEFSVHLLFAYFWTHAAFSEASIARSCCSIDFVLSCWMLDLTTSTDFVFWFLHPPFLNGFFVMVTYGVTVEFCYHPALWSLFSLQKKHIVLTTLIIFCIAFFQNQETATVLATAKTSIFV